MKKVKIEILSSVQTLTKELSDDEKTKVLDWAQKSLIVVDNKQLSKLGKIKALNNLPTPEAAKIFIFALLRIIKSKAWTNQSWARRLGIVGASIGVATFGSQMAGLAAMGSGVGISLALVTTIGATFLGVIVDELGKEIKK